MKQLIVLLTFISLLSCKKDSDESSASGSGSIEYKVNGTLVIMDNQNLREGEGVAFAKQLKGTLVPATRYLLNAQQGTNNFMGFAIITDSLKTKTYRYDNESDMSYAYSLMFDGKITSLLSSSDYFEVAISDYKNKTISGTFKAAFSNFSGERVAINDGKLKNIPVTY